MEEGCHLLELPSELRLAIYNFAFPVRTVHLWVDKNVYRWRSYTQQSAVSLLRTCKTVRDEAAPVFHDNTTVHFSICDEFERPISRYHRFSPLDCLNTHSCKYVRKIQLSLHTLTEPLFDLLIHHLRGLLSRLYHCKNARAIEVHFEFWSTISDDALYEIYDALCGIKYNRTVEVGTCVTGGWSTLFKAPGFARCFDHLMGEIERKRLPWSLNLQESISPVVGPRDLIIRST